MAAFVLDAFCMACLAFTSSARFQSISSRNFSAAMVLEVIDETICGGNCSSVLAYTVARRK